MSLIGTLEQFGLANVLQRCEHFEKTGVLVLQQGPQWIEFYLNAGRLHCVGPLRTNASLGERLLQDGIISSQVLQEVLATLQSFHLSGLTEAQFARLLIEQGYVQRDILRQWTINNTVSVLKVLLTWTGGKMYFEENTPPPVDRLQVSMSLSSLLSLATTSATPVAETAAAPQLQRSQSTGQGPVEQSPVPPTSAASGQPSGQLTVSGPLSAPTLLTPLVPSDRPVASSGPVASNGPAASSPPSSDVARPSSDVARVPTLMSASQFLDTSSYQHSQESPAVSSPPAADVASSADADPSADAVPSSDSGALHNPGSLSAAELFAGIDFGSLSADELVPSPDFDATPSQDFVTHAEAAGTTRNTEPSRLDSGFLSLLGSADDSANDALQSPVPVAQPQPPKHIDTSFMRPEMVLLPADLSAYRQQDPQIQITPDQWCVLAHVDGQTTLAAICQLLNAAPEPVCRIAGELVAEGLIYPSLPDEAQAFEASPVSREMVASGLGGGYVAPGYASSAASPWSASMPAVAPAPHTPGATESQWGNGGNGATFVPGRGWVATPQPMLPLQPNEALMHQEGMAAPVNGMGSQSGIYQQMPNGGQPSGAYQQIPNGGQPSGAYQQMPMPSGGQPSGAYQQVPGGGQPSGAYQQVPNGRQPSGAYQRVPNTGSLSGAYQMPMNGRRY